MQIKFHCFIVFICTVLPVAAAEAPAKPIGGKPNIIFIFTDDQSQAAMSCMGNRQIKTPNIDRLAMEGVLFEN